MIVLELCTYSKSGGRSLKKYVMIMTAAAACLASQLPWYILLCQLECLLPNS